MPRLISTSSLIAFMVAVFFSAFTIAPWSSGSTEKNQAQQEIKPLQVGVAKINITPQTPIPMSGYGARDQVYQAIHDSLYAYALVFDADDRQAVLVTADLIGFSNQFCENTGLMIERATGIPANNIMISATHNHGGPVNNTYGISSNPDVTDYVTYSQKQIVEVVVRATKNLIRAKIGTGKGICTMNVNRRAPFADGTIWLGRNPEGVCDHSVSVLRIDDVADKPIAVLANWATHGTIGGQENYQVTGDWPGSTSRFVEDVMSVPAPITAGASGDIAPIYGPNNRFRDIDAIGKILADEVVRVRASIRTFEGASISTAKRTIVAKGRKPTDNYKPNQSLEPNDPVDINLSVIKVGGLVLTGISGEVMTEIGFAIKNQSPYQHTVVVTHCNGSAGYLLTDQTYTEGGYEAMVSQTMPGTADQIIDNLSEMIRSLP